MPRPVVAINTLAVQPHNEGTRTMLTRLLPALQRVDPGLELVLVCGRENRGLFDVDGEVIELPISEGRTLRRVVGDQVDVPRAVKGRADVLLTPASTGPLRAGMPHVAIVAAHLALPSCQAAAGADGLGRAHRVYYGWPFRRFLHNADRVLGISQFLADGLVRELGISADKVAGMPLGADPPAVPAPPIDGRGPLALFVGTLYEYKDADVAVRALAGARDGLPTGSRLVIVGKDPGGQHAHLRSIADDLGVLDAVDLRGPVPADELEHLYRTSSVLLLPSRCEGFGLPVAEAMSRNLPVIVADATSLPEVAGDAGIAVPPGDVLGFAAALRQVLGDPELRRSMAARGRRRAAALTWDATAEILRDHLRAALPPHLARRG